MQYQSDYILRLIEQMGSLLRRALEQVSIGSDEESYEILSQAVGLALDMDPDLAARVSAQSLVSLLGLNNVDDRVLGLVAESLDAQAGILEGRGDLVEATIKREQAAAVRSVSDPSRAN